MTEVALTGMVVLLLACGRSAAPAKDAADAPTLGDVLTPAEDVPAPIPGTDAPGSEAPAAGPDVVGERKAEPDVSSRIDVSASIDVPTSADLPAGVDVVEAGAGSSSDARDVWDPSCHYDCFGSTECEDGVVTLWEHVPVPCQYWNGSCPRRQVATCQRGCAKPRLAGASWTTCPTEICLENYPKQPGDPCTGDADCRPTRAALSDGGIVQNYLRCDLANQVCVVTQAPVLADWLAPCDPAIISTITKGSSGTRNDPSCGGGLCTYYAAQGQSCVYQGCTRPCRTDDECPTGAVCQIDVCPTTSSTGYCKPGPLNQIGTGLPCVP